MGGTGPWLNAFTHRPRPCPANLSTGTSFAPKDDHHSKSSRLVQQTRITNKPRAKGLWEPFKKMMKKTYDMDDTWVESRSGSVKSIINELGALKTFIKNIKDADEDDIHVSTLVREINNSLIKAVNAISKRNELHINEGAFRNFINLSIPEFDEQNPADWMVPVDEFVDDEMEREKDRMMSWMMPG